MNPLLSVITPASKGVRHLEHLIRDFKNQTLVKQIEHIIVWDGKVPTDVQEFMKIHEKDYNIRFCHVVKDLGDMKNSPGTKPRNHGISISRGEYLVFCDDDDRYKDTYCETLVSNMSNKSITVVQMSCQESRIYRNGNPERTILVPEIDIHQFPVICHVGTPCFCVPKEWAIAEPWRHEPEHDFRFIKRICDRFNPIVQIIGGMLVDVDGIVTRGIRDWVSKPPFYRN